MEQDLLVEVPAQEEVWGEARDRAEEEWVDRLPQVRVEVVSVRIVVQQYLTLPDNLVIKEVVRNVEQI
jgi:hypothetical protein